MYFFFFLIYLINFNKYIFNINFVILISLFIDSLDKKRENF